MLRRLPEGGFREGCETGCRGTIVDIDMTDPSATVELSPGAAVEIQSETWLRLGVVEEQRGIWVSIRIEHSFERGQLESIREVWGDD